MDVSTPASQCIPCLLLNCLPLSAAVTLKGVTVTAAAKDLRCICAELKDLASDSLNLLKAAIYDERFPVLFDLDVYGSIVGMFELNNLGVSDHSPA